MKVLMLGWEFPPYFVGGVGIVCYEMTRALQSRDDVEIEYVMAYGPKDKKRKGNLTIASANVDKLRDLKVKEVPTMMYNYDSCESYSTRYEEALTHFSGTEHKDIKQIYGANLIEEVYLYARRVAALYSDYESFDVIHAHDWTTLPAALLLRKLTGKPVVFHAHITELDKTGGNGGHPKVFEIEMEGLRQADLIISVSNFTKQRLIANYGVDPSKIRVVHNGGVSDLKKSLEDLHHAFKKDKIVLFAGRMTLQKGPEYFLHAARRVLEYEPNTKFVLAGGGDMLTQMIELSVELGIEKNVFFHGPFSREEADKFFSLADVFVMPSVSEPFGIVPLEALAKGTPTIVSKQSGISEVLTNTFKVDFWDIDEMAHKILALLRYDDLHEHMKYLGYEEYDNFSWEKPVSEIVNVYKELVLR